MTNSKRDIALVISDVDGTLVGPDKTLAPGTIAAARRLAQAGIGLTLASSRPPIGLKSLVAALDLTLPLGAFNGAVIIGPDLVVIEETLIPAETAREAAGLLAESGLDVWVFADGLWSLRDPAAPYVDLERRTLQAEPNVVEAFGSLLDRAAKIVGVGADPDHLAACEARIGAALGERAEAHRSQAYYLDVTPAGAGKGQFVEAMSRRLGVDRSRIAALGDAANDAPMFARAGLSIAMGNADRETRDAASLVTGRNDSDGWARAIDEFILTR